MIESIIALLKTAKGYGHVTTKMVIDARRTDTNSVCNLVCSGEDYPRCYVHDVVQFVLKRWDEYDTHYDTKERRKYDNVDA